MSIDPRAEAARDAAVEPGVAAGAGVDTVEPPAPDSADEAPVVAVAAADESTSWADGTTHEALLVIAEGITQLAGFDVAAVSVVRDSQHMQVMAVAGSDEARDILLGTFTPITRLMEELEHAEDWGMFQFVPHENLDPESESWGWVPDFEPVAGPDAWHPMDLLVAPLYGPNGELRGTLSIDCPTDGLRPDEARRRILNRYAEQAARALYIAVERESFAEQVRVLSATRDVVRNAARERNIGVMLDKIQPSLVEGFRSLGSWIHTFDEDGHGAGAIYAGDGARLEMPQHLVTVAERAATDSWRAQRVETVSRHLPRNPAASKVSEQEFQEILAFLEAIGVGSLLFVPGRGRAGVPGQPGAHPGAGRRGVDPRRGRCGARGRPRPGPGGAQRASARPRARAGARAQGPRRLQDQADRHAVPRAEEPAGRDAGQHRVPRGDRRARPGRPGGARRRRPRRRTPRARGRGPAAARQGRRPAPPAADPAGEPARRGGGRGQPRLDRRPAPGQGDARGRARPAHRGGRPGGAGHHGHQPAQQRDEVLLAPTPPSPSPWRATRRGSC